MNVDLNRYLYQVNLLIRLSYTLPGSWVGVRRASRGVSSAGHMQKASLITQPWKMSFILLSLQGSVVNHKLPRPIPMSCRPGLVLGPTHGIVSVSIRPEPQTHFNFTQGRALRLGHYVRTSIYLVDFCQSNR